jgi:signal transduction histidine kinase
MALESRQLDRKHTVLTIDDERIIRQVLRAYLEKMDFEVTEAVNGRDGIEKFRATKPDVVLVDLLMPEVDGLAVLKTLHRESPETPLIVISGTGMISHAVSALRQGAWDYIFKPIESIDILRHSISNVLERARLIRENHRYQVALEEKVAARTSTLEKAITELKHRNAELVRLNYTVSHDLKTPLITIKGFISRLEEDLRSHDAASANRNIQIIDSAADKMYAIFEDILKLTRASAIRTTHEPIRLSLLAGEAAEMISNRFPGHPVTIDIDGELPVISGDPVQLHEVFQNLLENAAKFMGSQSSPRIEIGCDSSHDGHTCFVRDNGIGIASENHESIFNLFDRINPGVEGTGIGLAIVKRVIEAHGGRIWVESDGTGRGSTFYFTLGESKAA